MAVYFVQLGLEGPVKIGSTIHLERRLKQLAKEWRVETYLLGILDGGEREEREHHRRFAHLRIKPDRPGPCERFHPEPDLLGYIERECLKPDIPSAPREFGPACPVRLELSPMEYRLLRMMADHEDIDMADYAHQVLGRFLQDEADRRGWKWSREIEGAANE